MRGVPKVSRSMSVHKFGTTWRRIFSRLSFSEKSHSIRIFENAREINLAQGALIEINGPGSKKKISTRIFEIPAFKIMKIMVEYLYTKVLANSLPDIDMRAREATLFSRAIYLPSRALGKLLRSVCPRTQRGRRIFNALLRDRVVCTSENVGRVLKLSERREKEKER